MDGSPPIEDIQKFIAVSAIGPSALRNQGKGVIGRVRRYLSRMELAEIQRVRSEAVFQQWLDEKTSRLVRNQKVKWGAARKALNLFLRDCLYNKFLNSKYSLERIEPWMEIPLDSIIAGVLKNDAGRGQLPVWPKLKRLRKNESERFQHHAMKMAAKRNIARVHLDVSIWVNNR